MKFEYKKVPSSSHPADPWVIKPYLTIRLSAEGKTVQLDALIDSGAEASLFHSSVAKVFGFDLKAGLKKEYFGITGEPAICYFHPVQLQVVGLSHSIDLAVAFTEASSVGALLGQADFFQHFKITFERYKERMGITPSRS